MTGSLRVLVFAPIGRDARACREVLSRASVNAAICQDIAALLAALPEAAAVLVAEEGLFGDDASQLYEWVQRQPAWSDLPFVVLTGKATVPALVAWRHSLINSLRNVSFLERPVQGITLTTAMQAAVRARVHQLEVRTLLEARERAAAELENVVLSRTRELHVQMAERTRIEEALRQTQKIEAIGQLTGGVAHDFNNLLMVISGGLDMLERTTDSARRRVLLDGMRQATQRGAGLTRQLLAFSRRQALQPVSVDLARQIGGMRELLARSLRSNVRIEYDFPDDLWPVQVDPGELELVVLNLAVNARDAMPDGGSITISAENAGERSGLAGQFVRIAVEDTGTGMNAEVKRRVFEPFFTTKEVGKGSGLGLAQVYGFATASGGAVEIDSEEGRGTRVTLFLPRSLTQPAIEVAASRSEVARREAESSGCVLLVEDDDEVAALVKQMLHELGYEVIRAATAQGALGALANQRAVDLVFSDIMMPGEMDGLKLAREIRARRPEVPVLLTTGYSEPLTRQVECGGPTVLGKPYRLDELAAALRLARQS